MLAGALAGTVIPVKDHTVFKALSNTFVQAEMGNEENGLRYIQSDLVREKQPFRVWLHERDLKVWDAVALQLLLPSLVA